MRVFSTVEHAHISEERSVMSTADDAKIIGVDDHVSVARAIPL